MYDRPFVVCKDGTLVYGDYDRAKAEGRETVAAYVLDADPTDPAAKRSLRDLRRTLIAKFGPDDGTDLRVIDGQHRANGWIWN